MLAKVVDCHGDWVDLVVALPPLEVGALPIFAVSLHFHSLRWTLPSLEVGTLPLAALFLSTPGCCIESTLGCAGESTVEKKGCGSMLGSATLGSAAKTLIS